MNNESILLRSMYIQTDDGYLEIKYYGRRIVWIGAAPVFFLEVADWPWHFDRSEPIPYRPWWMPSLALVKEGPKALTVYHRSD